MEPPQTFFDYCWALPITHAYLMVLSDRLWHPNDIFSQFPNISKIFFFHSIGVDTAYRKKGIAKELVRQGIKVRKTCLRDFRGKHA